MLPWQWPLAFAMAKLSGCESLQQPRRSVKRDTLLATDTMQNALLCLARPCTRVHDLVSRQHAQGKHSRRGKQHHLHSVVRMYPATSGGHVTTPCRGILCSSAKDACTQWCMADGPLG